MSFSDSSTDNANQLSAMLSKLLGTEVTSMLTLVISEAITKAQVNMPGGGTMYAGPNAMFGSVDVGKGVYGALGNNTMNDVMSSARDATEIARKEFRENNARLLGQAGEGNIATQKVSDFIFDRSKGRALETGLATASKYMGVGTPLGMGAQSEAQIKLNEAAGKFNERITKDFQQNEAAYAGLDGRQVGQVVTEMSRAGLIDLKLASTEKGREKLQDQVREAANTASAASRSLGLPMGQAINEANKMFGGSFLGMFGDRGEAMMNNIAQTSQLSGRSSQFTMGLAETANQMVMQRGGPAGAGLAVATSAIDMETMSRDASVKLDPSLRAMVSAPGFMRGVTTSRAKAATSQTAKAVAGGVARLRKENASQEVIDKFIAQAGQAASDGSGIEGITAAFNELAETDAGAAGLVAASNTRAGKLAMKEGVGLEAASAEQSKREIRSRKRSAERALAGENITDAQRKAVMSAMDGGQDLESALDQAGVTGDFSEAISDFNRTDAIRAKRAGFDSVEAYTAAQVTQNSPQAKARLAAKKKAMSMFGKIFKGKGDLSGMRGLKAMLEKKGADGTIDGVSVKEMFEGITGNTEVSAEDMGAALGMSSDVVDLIENAKDLSTGEARGLKEAGSTLSQALSGKKGGESQKRAMALAKDFAEMDAETAKLSPEEAKAAMEDNKREKAKMIKEFSRKEEALGFANKTTFDEITKKDAGQIKGLLFGSDDPKTEANERRDKIQAFQKQVKDISDLAKKENITEAKAIEKYAENNEDFDKKKFEKTLANVGKENDMNDEGKTALKPADKTAALLETIFSWAKSKFGE